MHGYPVLSAEERGKHGAGKLIGIQAGASSRRAALPTRQGCPFLISDPVSLGVAYVETLNQPAVRTQVRADFFSACQGSPGLVLQSELASFHAHAETDSGDDIAGTALCAWLGWRSLSSESGCILVHGESHFPLRSSTLKPRLGRCTTKSPTRFHHFAVQVDRPGRRDYDS